MALALFDRVQETTTTTGTGSLTLAGAVSGFQSFAVVGNGNTCYYTIVDGSEWEVGIGTYSTTGPALARTTILSNSLGNTSPITLTSGSKQVFLTYPAEKAVYVDDGSTVVLPGGMKINGTLETNSNPYVGGSYGGNQFYPTNGGGAQVNSLYDGTVTINVGTTGTIENTSTFDVNGNLLTNSVTQSLAIVTAAAGITTLTPASPHFQILVGTGVQTFKLPDATTLATGSSWVFDNDSTGNLTVTDNAGATVDIVAPGGYSTAFLEADGTVGGTWGKYGMLPSEVNWGTNSLDLGGSTAITNGVWNGTTIASAYGGTGLTTFAGANNALYSTGASTLTAGTLPAAAGGTGLTSFTANGIPYASSTSALTTGNALSFDGNNLLVGTTISPTGTGKISTPTGYTAPDNAAGAGTTLNILGSTGTGQAGATGGNGLVQIIGGGGTSTWTTFAGATGGRRRGGIYLQAGLAAGDAGATYYSGSTINIFGSNGTNNGISTGLGSQILLTAGAAVSPTGTNNGGAVNLNFSSATSGGNVSMSAGFGGATSSNGGSATVSGGSSGTGTGGTLFLNGGTSNSAAGGPVNIQAGLSNGVAGANVSISSGTGTANGKIGFTIGALGEVAQFDAVGNLTTTNGATIQGLTVGRGAGAVVTNTAVGVSALATNISGAQNTSFGYETLKVGSVANYNTAVGYQALYNSTYDYNTAIGYQAGISVGGAGYSTSVGTFANAYGESSTAIGYSATASNNNSIAIGGSTTASGFYSLAAGPQANSGGWYSTAIGFLAQASQDNAIAIGSSSLAASTNGIAIGPGSYTENTAAHDSVISIGNGARSYGSIAIGKNAVTNATNKDCIVIGHDITAAAPNATYMNKFRTGVTPTGTAWTLTWDDATKEVYAAAGAPPVGPSWYSYEVSTGSNISVALPSGWDPAVSQLGYLWTFTSSGGSPYSPMPPFAWNNLGTFVYFFRVFQSNFGHAPPYPEFLDPTNFDFSSSPGIYTMLYINPLADSKTNLYVYYPPNSPNSQFGSGQFSASGFPLTGSDQVGHSVIQMLGDFSNSSTFVVPSSTGTLDEVVYEPVSDKTIFFISHTAAQLPQVQAGTPVLAATSSPFTGSMTFWYSY